MKKVHGIGGPVPIFTEDDIENLRGRINVGDPVKYPVMVFGKKTGELFVRSWVNATVTGVYPHLVTVSGPLRPVRTITYVDMLLTPRILSGCY